MNEVSIMMGKFLFFEYTEESEEIIYFMTLLLLKNINLLLFEIFLNFDIIFICTQIT